MNNSSPLIPQGSLLEQQNKGRARFKVAILCVFGFHVLLFGGVLMLGCKKETSSAANDATTSGTGTTDTMMSATSTPTNVETPMTAPSNPVVVTPPPAAPVMPVAPVTPAVTPGTAQEYTLVKGDTYSSISKKFGVSIKLLENANPTMPATKLMPGKKIQVPAPTVATTAATSGTMATLSPDNSDLYVVKSGDSLTTIAHGHGTSVKALMAENSLKTTRIRVGDKLRLPARTLVPPAVPVDATSPSTATSSVPGTGAPSTLLR